MISCGEEAQIQSYSAPNHYQGPVVAWKLPEQWGENPGMSGMMAGSFHVKTEQGPRGRIKDWSDAFSGIGGDYEYYQYVCP